MPFWRRREPLHERLAREAGLGEQEQPPHDTTPRWGEAGIHGIARPREWDATALVEAPEAGGDEASFVALPDGTLLVETGGGVEPFAAALDERVEAPYRAQAVRRAGSLWAVAARRIEVVRLPGAQGDEIELTAHEGERSLAVDGMPTFGGVPELERLAAERGLDSYAAHASRLDGDLWEVRLAPL